jgi:hypothetical protein
MGTNSDQTLTTTWPTFYQNPIGFKLFRLEIAAYQTSRVSFSFPSGVATKSLNLLTYPKTKSQIKESTKFAT